MNRIAENIKSARLKAGLTEKQLAKKCGLSVGYIIQIESGKKIVKEDLADKILKALGEKVVVMEPTEPETVVKESPKAKPQPAQVVNVQPNAQWADALSGVIKKFPVYDETGKKVVDYKELPILSKKIEGHHPDKIIFVKAPSDDMAYKRIQKGDVLTLTITSEIENNAIYVYEKNQTRHIAVLRKEGNKEVSFINESTGRNPVKMKANEIKLIGKCLKVEFVL